MAAICHGGWIPISAGVYRGVRVTGSPGIKDDLVNAGAIWEDAPVVVDRHFVSSRKPDDLPDFCRGILSVFRRTWRSLGQVIESTLRHFGEPKGDAVHARQRWRARRSSFRNLLPNPRFGFDSIGSTDIIAFPWQQCQRIAMSAEIALKSRRLPEAKFEPTDLSARRRKRLARI